MPGLAQPFAFVEQVLAFRGGRQLHAQVRGGDGHAEVLEVVGLVDDEHVHAQRFELDARQRLVVAGLLAVAQELHGGLGAFARRLQPFDGRVLVAPGLGGGLDGLGELVDAGAHVPQPAFLADVQLAEPAFRHDHRVPVAGGDPSPESARRFGVALRVLVHDEDPAGRVEPEHVAGPLVHEVVGDHEHRLGRLAEAFRLVGEGDALERLAGSDDVGDEGSLVAAQGAGHRVLLMRTQDDAVGDAGRGQVGSVDVAGPQAVEPAVVQSGEPSRAVGVPEHPLVPRVADRVGLLDGGHRGLLVLDAFGFAGRRGLRGGVLGDGDLRVVQACLQQLERVAVLGAVGLRGLVVDVAAARVADAPLSELGNPVDRVLGELAGREPVAAHVERLHHEVVDVPGGDPRGSQRRLDLLGLQWGGLHAFQQAGHVFEPFRVRLVGARGLGVLRQFPPLLDLFLAACAERLVVVGACVDDAWRDAVGVVLLPLAQVFGQFAGDAPDPFAEGHVGGETFGEPRGIVGVGHESACHSADGRVHPDGPAVRVVGAPAFEQVGEDRGLVGGVETVGVRDLVDEEGEVPDGHVPVREDRRVVLRGVAVAPCPAQCVPQRAGAVRLVPRRRLPRLPLAGVGPFEGDARVLFGKFLHRPPGEGEDEFRVAAPAHGPRVPAVDAFDDRCRIPVGFGGVRVLEAAPHVRARLADPFARPLRGGHVLRRRVGGCRELGHGLGAGAVPQMFGHGRDVVEFRSHVAGEVVLGGHDRAGVGVAYDPVAQAGLGLLDGGVGEARDEFQIDPAGAVEADVQRVVQAVRMVGHGRYGADGPLREAFRLADEPSFFVGLLQRHDEVAAGFLTVVGAEVGAVVQASELAGEPVVCLVEFLAFGLHGGVVHAGGVEFEALEFARQVAQADHAAQSARLVSLTVGGLGDGGAVAVPDHAARVDRVFERGHMVRADDDLRTFGRFHLAQLQRRPAVGDLHGEHRPEPFADLFRVALEDDVEVAAEPADHWSDVAHRVRGHVVGDRLVDVDGHVLVAGHGDRCGVDPCLVGRAVERPFASAQHKHVGDGLGAGLAGERRGRQTHHADELGFPREVGAHGLGAFVERVPAGQQHRDAAGAQRVHRAFDEVVVQGEAGRAAVRGPVVEADVARVGHVADGEVERSLLDGAVREVRVEDRGVRVQRGGDARADRVEFHARHVRRDVVGDAGHEVAGAASGLQHLDGCGADVERVPHGLDHRAGRVVGGQCGGARLRVLFRGEGLFYRVADRPPFRLVRERVRASAPAGISAQRIHLLR